MCTIGYHKKLKQLFKNRDKNAPVDEVIILKPDYIALKSKDADYFSLALNSRGCAFVTAAVNTPAWTALALKGKYKEARIRYEKENEGLLNPVSALSKYLPRAGTAEELLEMLMIQKVNFMGYNILLADGEKAVHVEVYRRRSRVSWLTEDMALTNHFTHLRHGPQASKEYPSSFARLKAARKKLADAVSIEDIFQMLKSQDGSQEAWLWRKEPLLTISSAVIDMESHAIYYAPDHTSNYSRIEKSIAPRGGEKVFIEMSRYIDLPTYHNIERSHPFYVEMIDEIQSQIKSFHKKSKHRFKQDATLQTLELGAGTGLCSIELVKSSFIKLDALEIDNECCKILASHPEMSKSNVILGDAAAYCKKHHYDLVVSTFAHDHIHYNKRFNFAKNIYNNLKKGGLYIMGGELLGYFSNDLERKKALFKYHNHIIELALQQNRVQLSELENNALKSGLDMVGDFKRHEHMFEEEMKSAGFSIVSKKKMGPLDKDDVGGVFVYVFEVI